MSYLVTTAGAGGIGLAIGSEINSFIAVKDSAISQLINLTTVTALSFLGFKCIDDSIRIKSNLAIGLLSVAFGAVASQLSVISEENYAEYEARQKARVFIDPHTVIGMKPVTIADQHCQHKKGETVSFKQDGQTLHTVCPQ